MAEHEVPDLHDVEEKIHAAHDAEDQLLHTMPNAIQPDDDAYQGMSGPTEGDVEQVDESGRSDDVDEAAIESTVVEDDSPPPGNPDHA
jgi:hypothetical protein